MYAILIQCIFVFWQKAKAFAYLVFPNTTVSVAPEKPLQAGSDPMAHGIITSVTHGAMSGTLLHFL
jgi:exosome complex component RRP46